MRRSLSWLFLACLLAGVVALQFRAQAISREALALHIAAGDAARPWQDRLADSRAAVRLRPDVLAFRQREASIQATLYTEKGELDAARLLLIEVWGLDRSNVALRAQLRAVNQALVTRDSRKAHVLHGREKPGGVLEPEDLMP
jgi:hypothetical protein